MRISVVIPTRKRPELMKAALASVAAQEYPDLEIIVVDNSESPELQAMNAQIVAGAGSRARYVCLPVCGSAAHGPSVSRNAGIDAATGDLIGFCDDDDLWSDVQRLSIVSAAFAANHRLDLLFANQETRFRGQTVKHVWQTDLVQRLKLSSVGSGRLIELSKSDCLCVPGSFGHLNTCIFRRDLLVAIQGFWSGVQFTEDLDLFVRAIDAARSIAYLDLTVSIHNRPDRTRQDNASTQLDAVARSTAVLNVANHLMETCHSSAALTYTRLLAAQECRDLALAMRGQHEDAKAWAWARVGLGWRFTLQWAAVSAALWLRWALRVSRTAPDVP